MAAPTVQDIFASAKILKPARFEELKAAKDPDVRFFIAMTPRSGSSHLCDVLKSGKLFGRPNEMLSREFIPNILRNVPAAHPDQYLQHVFRAMASHTGISGIKASWFQFRDFRQAMSEPDVLLKAKYIYLIRRDSAAQAVSLYRATQTNVFHTNVEHSQESLQKLEELPYDYKQIKNWHLHILKQEDGWKSFFAENRIFPLCIHYEDIDEDVGAVATRIAAYIGRPQAAKFVQPEKSVFRKIGTRTSVEWAARYTLERDAELRLEQAAAMADAAAAAASASGPSASAVPAS